ncbi:MAG: NAD(P)/FAD-dependent oxidoreductase [Thermodesulfobacteriota bacterium]
MNYTIIGNSAAAVGAVEAIRSHDRRGEIVIISREPYRAYSRPLITYLLAGQIGEDRMFYRERDFYRRNKIRTFLEREVKALQLQQRRLLLTDGETLDFNKLLIATGGSPIAPPVEGIHLKGVFTFMTWDDAKEMRRYVKDHPVESVVIIGGGLIGLKAAEAFLAQGLQVTVVELMDRILSVVFDKKASEMIERQLKAKGIHLITENTVEKILGPNNRVETVVLKDQRRIDCQMVVFGIGVLPNIGLVKDTPIRFNKGIQVDSQMETNISGIYAAGDVVEILDMLLETIRPIAIWPNAYRQGWIAGCNMAGVSKRYEGSFAMNSIDICDTPTISVGMTQASENGFEILHQLDREKGTYRKIILKDGVIVGAILIGQIDRAGIYTGLIKEKIDVSGFKDILLREDFGLIYLPNEYRKHLVKGEGVFL